MLDPSTFNTFQWSKLWMEKNRKHHNSRFVRIFKTVFVAFAFGLPIYLVFIFSAEQFQYFLSSIENFFSVVFMIILPTPFFLIAAYFYTDLEVDERWFVS